MAINDYTFNPNLISGCIGGNGDLDVSSIVGGVASELGLNESSTIGNIPIGNFLNGTYSLAAGENSEQRSAGVQSLAQGILKMLAKIGTGEAAAASSEVSKNGQAASELTTESEEQISELNEKFTSIQNSIDKENQDITNALNDAEALKSEEEAEAQKIQDAIQEVETLKKQLSSETDPAKQQELLSQISGQILVITGAASNIAGLKSAVEGVNSQVKTAYENLKSYSAEAVETSETGVSNLEALVKQAKDSAAANASSQAQAPVNKNISIEAGKAATKTSTNIVTGVSLAPQLIKVSADQGSAAGIREIGSATIWTQITKGVGNITNGAEILTMYGSTIGSALGDCNSLIGEWNETVAPMSKVFGSIEDFQKKAVALGSIVNDDMGTVGGSNVTLNSAYDPNYDSKNGVQTFVKEGLMSQSTWSDADNQQKNNLKTPKTQQLKFGI